MWIGFNAQTVPFLVTARRFGVDFERTLTIGRQNLFADAAGIQAAHLEAGARIAPGDAEAIVRDGDGYIEPLLRYLGADRIESLDASAYESATLVHDLNLPLPDELRGQFSLVIDGGSLEHVFNFTQALRSCMDAVADGGHLILITPSNNHFGHGFYQFSPDLFYRALAPENGFRVILMLMRPCHRWAHWYQVSDPKQAGARVTLTSPWPSLLFVIAERSCVVEPFMTAPQQSDYTVAWADPNRPAGTRLRTPIYARLPGPLRRAAKVSATMLGTTSDRSHFKPVKLADLDRRKQG